MLYGVDYRSFHSAVHGVILFAEMEQAIEAHQILKAVESGTIKDRIECEMLTNEAFGKAYAVVDEIDYRSIQPSMEDLSFNVNHNGFVSVESDDVQIVNHGQFVDVY